MAAISGPFGRYERGTPGAVLNALHALGIPLNCIEGLSVGERTVKESDGSEFATYKWFDGIDVPLFRLPNGDFRQNLRARNGGYVLTLWVHDTPAMLIEGNDADIIAWETINRCMTNYIHDEFYQLSKDAGAFFQTGSYDSGCGFFYVEFWKPAGAQAWLDGFNRELSKRRLE